MNFYWAPTHEVVLMNDQQRGTPQEIHEFCHAHQHWSISGGAPLAESDYGLGPWYATAEAASFMAAVDGLPFPWTGSVETSGLEDFAWTCTFWYLDPERLVTVGGQERYEWVRRNLP